MADASKPPVWPEQATREPRDTRGRWTAVAAAGGALAGAAAGEVGRRLVAGRRLRAALTDPSHDERIGRLTERVVERRKGAVSAAREMRESAIRRGFTKPAETEKPKNLNPVSQRVRQIRRLLGRMPADLERVQAMRGEADRAFDEGRPFPYSERQLADTAHNLERQIGPLADEKAYLLGARPKERKLRQGGVRRRKTEEWEITRSSKSSIKETVRQAKLKDHLAVRSAEERKSDILQALSTTDDDWHDLSAALGPTGKGGTPDQRERHAALKAKRGALHSELKSLADALNPITRAVGSNSRARKLKAVARGNIAAVWTVAPHKATTRRSDISDKGMKRIRDLLREEADDIERRGIMRVARRRPVYAATVREKLLDRIGARSALRQAKWRPRTLIGGALVGAVAGGAAARLIASMRRQRDLGKAFDPALHPRHSQSGQFVEGRHAPRALFLIGLPGAGKTTWRREHLARAERPTTVISPDDMVERHAQTAGISVKRAYHEVDHKAIEKAARQKLREAVARGDDVIIDRTNLRAKPRASWTALIPAHYRREAVVFNTPHAEVIRRLALRPSGQTPAHWQGLEEMKAGAQIPVRGDGEFHRVHTLSPGDTLAKAAPDDEDLGATEHLDAAAAKAEQEMAPRLAHVFGGWRDEADRLGQGGRPLTETIRADLDHATRPLEDALRGGAGAPIPGIVEEQGERRDVVFTFAARSPEVERFIKKYRKDKIAELTEQQRQTIQDVLVAAARRGESPDALARTVRETVGLTSYQAGLVRNYRKELEELNPKALERQLRDRRYDRTLSRAIDGGKSLESSRVDRMVEAYHRRMLAFRAMTIARTEAVGAANNGHVAAVRAMLGRRPGYTVTKTWMATNDDKTRPDHREMHGQTVIGIDTPFVAPDDTKLRWPHDPDGAAKQVINCRCTCVIRLVPRSLAAIRGPAAVPGLPKLKEDA